MPTPYIHIELIFKVTIIRNGPLCSAHSTAGGNSSFGSAYVIPVDLMLAYPTLSLIIIPRPKDPPDSATIHQPLWAVLVRVYEKRRLFFKWSLVNRNRNRKIIE